MAISPISNSTAAAVATAATTPPQSVTQSPAADPPAREGTPSQVATSDNPVNTTVLNGLAQVAQSVEQSGQAQVQASLTDSGSSESQAPLTPNDTATQAPAATQGNTTPAQEVQANAFSGEPQVGSPAEQAQQTQGVSGVPQEGV